MSRRTNRPAATTELLDLPNPFIADYGRLRVMEAADTPVAELHTALLDGSYRKPFLIEDGILRYLHFGLTHVQSAMRIDRPDELNLRYTQKMMAFLLFAPDPGRITMLGLGGGSLVKFCHRHLPRCHIEAVEIDPAVIALRRHFMVPDDDERFRVIEADGAEYLARREDHCDVLLVDAFDESGVAPSIADREFMRNALNCLSTTGILVMNLAGNQDRYRPLIPLMRELFAGRLRMIRVSDDGNHILFGFKDAGFEAALAHLPKRARALQLDYGLDFPGFAQQLLHPSAAPRATSPER